MDNKIVFDSSDWNSIRDTIDKINEAGQMQVGETAEGETILFDVVDYGEGDCLVTDVLQRNGWVRKNIYHPKDHDIEEIYCRGDK